MATVVFETTAPKDFKPGNRTETKPAGQSGQLLSTCLAEILAPRPESARLSLNDVITQTQGRGLYLMMMVLCLPFVGPLPLLGASTPLGAIICLLAARLALDYPPQLPAFIGERKLPAMNAPWLAKGGVRLMRWLERHIRPRGSGWMAWRTVRSFNAALIAWLAFLLALPLPIPGTNLLPAQAIMILAACMLQGDGRIVWFGYLSAALANAYFAAWGVAFWFFPGQYEAWLQTFFAR